MNQEKITSVLIFPFQNKLEVRVSRGPDYTKIAKVRIYTAHYSDTPKVKRLAKLATKLIELNTLEMIKNHVFVLNPLR